MKVLQIIETAYRATLEEQDDTVIWFTHTMKGAGADLSVMLCSNAVNYAVKGQDAAGLSFGAWKQTQPPRIGEDLVGLIGKGIPVHVVEEDLLDRGIAKATLVDGVIPIKRSGIAGLMDAHDQVWHW